MPETIIIPSLQEGQYVTPASKAILLIASDESSENGVDVPYLFGQLYGEQLTEELDFLLSDTNNDYYWTAWRDILQTYQVQYEDQIYTLVQVEGDVYAIPKPNPDLIQFPHNFISYADTATLMPYERILSFEIAPLREIRGERNEVEYEQIPADELTPGLSVDRWGLYARIENEADPGTRLARSLADCETKAGAEQLLTLISIGFAQRVIKA